MTATEPPEPRPPSPEAPSESAPLGAGNPDPLRDWTDRPRLAAALACAVVLVDLLAVRQAIFGLRSTLAVGGILAMVHLARPGDRFAPLRPPVGGFFRWLVLGGWLGLAVAAATAVVFAFAAFVGRPLALDAMDPTSFRKLGFRLVVVAPLLEETLYRLVLCLGLLPVVGSRITILSSTLAFAALHFAGGNPAPNNLLSGAVFAWVFLRSGNFVVPVVLHAAGNLFVCGFQVALFLAGRPG